MFLVTWFFSAGLINILRSSITIVYHFGKHNGLVALVERPLFIPKKFACLLKERVKSFGNGEKSWYKDYNLTYRG